MDKTLQKILLDIDGIKQGADALNITDQISHNQSAVYLSNIRKISLLLKDNADKQIKPLKQQIEALNAKFKPYVAQLKAVEDV